jgi:flagellar basal body-associated protein FliL
MADQASESRTPDAAAGEQAEGASKKKQALAFGGGGIAVLALAFALALLALPEKPQAQETHELEGPFVADISPSGGFQVNLAGRGGKHYLAMSVWAEVDAFHETYAAEVTADSLVQAKLTDAVLRVASRKTKQDLDAQAGKELFREELRAALEPVIFPIHVGNDAAAGARHAESGLRAGSSIDRSTFRGLFFDHELEVDAGKKLIRLDGGPAVQFEGEEVDLAVEDENGRTLHVDVTGIAADFHGTLHVGVMGGVRNIYFSSFLTQ